LRELQWLVHTAWEQLKERAGRPVVVGCGGERLRRTEKFKELTREAAARRGIIIWDVRGSSLRDQYYRNIYRRQILSSPPIACGPDAGEFDVSASSTASSAAIFICNCVLSCRVGRGHIPICGILY